MPRRIDLEAKEKLTPIVDAACESDRRQNDPRKKNSAGIRTAAHYLKVSPSAVHGSYYHAYHSPALRAALDLDPLGPATVAVKPCPECGNGHTAGYCTAALGPVMKRKRPAGTSRKRPRVWMPTNNQERAIEILMKHYPNLVVVDGDLILFVPDTAE